MKIYAQIARICHQNNKALCEAIGDFSQPDWEDAPSWQRESAINGVKFHMSNPDSKPEDSHNNWMQLKLDEGWSYGLEKNPEEKTHPCLVPYEKLSEADRIKDHVFVATVRSLENYVIKLISDEIHDQDRLDWLCALQDAGVDNWGGMSFAHELYESKIGLLDD